jgi:hypothetical protein
MPWGDYSGVLLCASSLQNWYKQVTSLEIYLTKVIKNEPDKSLYTAIADYPNV